MGWPGPLTHRQEVAWLYWREADYNHPARSDYYLAALAAWVKRSFVKDAAGVKDEDHLIKFRIRGDGVEAADQDQLKDILVGTFGGGAATKTRTRAEAIALGWRPADMTDAERRAAGLED